MAEDYTNTELENDPSIKYGKFLASPQPGEEIVISGISGAYPESNNIEEFQNNLFNKVDMVNDKETRWSHTHPEIPARAGKLKELRKFDSGFFGMHAPHVMTLDPMAKMLLEKTIEALFDAGINPSDLEGTHTGVYLGVCFSESEMYWYSKEMLKDGHAPLGCIKSLFGNRISYFLKLKGVSMTCDTACSSSMFALENAYKAIRMGQCESAIVAGANLCLQKGATLQFARLGVLSKEGVCRAFDEDGKGYVRAEALSVVYLQKAKNCKRIYAKIVHAKTNCDGYKEEGITYPSGDTQYALVKEIYFESGVNPKDLSFLEAHGTGTQVGDPEELNGIDKFFGICRDTPLLIGSVKSNIGHSEPTSGLCSIAKAIIAFETNFIPPNINFKTPRKSVKGLMEGRLEVVTEKTPFRDQRGLIGVSSFGFGGGNAHILLKWNTKKKDGSGKPKDDIPRLVCVSGRTEEAIHVLLDDVVDKFDSEHIGLIHNIFRKKIKNHLYRGYTILSKNGELKRSLKLYNPTKNYIHIHFGNPTKNCLNILDELLNLPILKGFQESLQKCLSMKKLHLNTLISHALDSPVTRVLSAMITHTALAELLKELKIEFNSVSGQGLGELTKAYFENSISLEEILECVLVVATLSNNINDITDNSGVIYNLETLVKHKTIIEKEFKTILKSKNQKYIHNGSGILLSPPDYLVEALFQNKSRDLPNIPSNSTVLEIGQSLEMIGKRRYKILSIDCDKKLQGVLEILGSLYELGGQPQTQKLYPKVEFPVSRGTPMISSKIKWQHDHDHFVVSYHNDAGELSREVLEFKISLNDEVWKPLAGHVVDGRNLFPATGYLYLAWLTFVQMTEIELDQLKVVFENCKFKRACSLSKATDASTLDLIVMIQKYSGLFEITEGDVSVVTGRIRKCDEEKGVGEWISNVQNDLDDNFMNSKDIYKELRLRGYNYKGAFRGLKECHQSATQGKVEWTRNWIAFMDNMLQIKILSEDTRLLYVPTSIARLTVDPIKHLTYAENLKTGEGNIITIPVTVCEETGNIRSGGIEIRGLVASSIPRKKTTALPVLEKYEFVPNNTRLNLESSLRVFMQIALENNCGLKLKVVELIDEATQEDDEPLSPKIQDCLDDQPLVQSDITLFTSKTFDLNVKIENKKLKQETDCTLVIGSQLLQRSKILLEAINAASENGYILSRESFDIDISAICVPKLTVLSTLSNDHEVLVFLKKSSAATKPKVCINVSTKTRAFTWLAELQEAVKRDCDVIAYCQDEPLNGIVGLVNCIRREPGCGHVRTVFIVDKAPKFDSKDPFYKKQLDKKLGVNVWMDGEWGTYRHLLLGIPKEVEHEHCYSNSTVRGDLSSFKWIEGPLSLNTKLECEETLIRVHYSSLNFRDVMTASGKINVDVITRDRRDQECVQGFEFSGKTLSGQRVMGMVPQGALATLIKADSNMLWEIPEKWSLKEAATVPVVYGTCLYAFVVVGQIKPKDTVLIHSGTGGIGQAAINLCLEMGCTVFTTVGTEAKIKFIKKNFPKINERHIGNSRDVNFEQLVMKETNGKGVDIILNSLAEEKLFASVRCIARNGRFLEIGKFDLANNNELNLMPLKDGASYHGVMLDRLFNELPTVKRELKMLVQKYIDSGAVKPLMSNVFEKDQVEQAFRFMTAGKHMGKVLVEIRKEDEEDRDLRFKGISRYLCYPEKSYIICGGLGGFGLELADWLILRGAKNVILTSRKGVTTGYQRYRISIWKSYGCNIVISTENISTRSGCERLIKNANLLAPVQAIFNLAVVLRDAILENQTEEAFQTSFAPKAYATEYLDEVTRRLCPSLRDFVIFSSVSCGRGNAGQSNYGMANSVMERICEKRRKEGLPALAIEWGAIGDVGLVAEMQEEHVELEIGGTLQQSIANCLQVMDALLKQTESAIVSSMVVAEKRASTSSGNIVEVIGGLMGIRDMKMVSLHSTLPELGMDSMTGVEVKQTLEREYDIFLTPAELRSITLARIQEMWEASKDEVAESTVQEQALDIKEIIKFITDYDESTTSVFKLNSKSSDKKDGSLPRIIALPGIEGVPAQLQILATLLEAEVYGLRYCDYEQKDSIPDMADTLLPYVIELISPSKPFHILGHSLGAVVAIEIVSKLEKLGYCGTITLIDGSPKYLKKIIELMTDVTEDNLMDQLIAGFLELQLNYDKIVVIMKEISACSTLDQKLAIVAQSMIFDEHLSLQHMKDFTISIYKRILACYRYTPTFDKLKSKVRLYKPTVVSAKIDSDDYYLGSLCEQPVEVKMFEGTHNTILENEELAKTIIDSSELPLINGFDKLEE